MSKLVELIDPTLSLMTFLTLFLGAFWLGFPLAVWLSDMLVSANADERARERAALAGTARPQP